MTELIEKAQKIQCLISDLDGVLTDGHVYIDNHGNEQKSFNLQDGMGLKLLMAAGIEVAIITTSRSKLIDYRMQQLGIHHVFTGQLEKKAAYTSLKTKLQLPDSAFAYIGDDLPDIAIIRQVGLGVAVANARLEVKEFACMQTQCNGGEGAVRELCDFILKSQNKFDSALQGYFAG